MQAQIDATAVVYCERRSIVNLLKCPWSYMEKYKHRVSITSDVRR